MQKARGLFPVKTAFQIAEITRYSVRSCEAWMAGETKIPADALVALIRSEHGLDFLAAVMADSRPPWWGWLLRLGVAASAMRRRAADRRLLEQALSADQDITDAIADADALLVRTTNVHRPFSDALGAMVGAPHRAVARKT